jgi:hypothetical protein
MLAAFHGATFSIPEMTLPICGTRRYESAGYFSKKFTTDIFSQENIECRLPSFEPRILHCHRLVSAAYDAGASGGHCH